MHFQKELDDKGYCVIPNVLTPKEVTYAYNLFKEWQRTIPDHDHMHEMINPYHIYKYHEVGHTRHAWFIRTRPAVQDVFKKLWNTDDLMLTTALATFRKLTEDKYSTHTEQPPGVKGLQCYQGFVALTIIRTDLCLL